MDKQHSDHIENRFRQAAENFLPPPNEEAWKRMEAILDKDQDKRRVFIWWWWPLSLLSFLVICTGLYHYYSNGPEEAAAAQVDGRPLTNSNTSAPEQYRQVATNERVQQAAQSSTGTLPQKKSGSDQPAKLTKQSTIVGVGPDGNNTDMRGQSQRKGNGLAAVYKRHPANSPHAEDVKKNTDEDAKAEDNTGATVPAPVTKLPSLQQTVGIAIGIPDAVLRANNGLHIYDSLLHTAGTVPEEKAKPARLYGVISAAKNATNLQKFDVKNTATVYGAELGYHLNHFLSIQAGFHAGRKIYLASASDYTVKPGSYLSMVRILSIDANCLIYDIPLSLRFDMMQNRNNALYAIAGVSSFIMNTENYKYHYNTSTGGYRQQTMKYKGNVDLLSSVNLAVGFEQSVFKTLYVQAEPYAKLPLSGIGEGKIKLYSLGIQIGLKYQPLKKQRR